MSPGTWTRITVIWDFGQTGPRVARVFFDGVEAASYLTDIAGPVSMPPASQSNVFFVGSWGTTDNEPAGGLVDDFKIWGAALVP